MFICLIKLVVVMLIQNPNVLQRISIAMETKNNNSIIKYLFAYLHLQK